MIFMLFCGSNQPKYCLLLLLMTIIVFLYLITEDIDHDINLHSLNYVTKLRNFNMKGFACELFGSIDFGCSST